MKPSSGSRPDSADNKDARIAALEAELEQSRERLRSFSYSVSHDLRAPLRAIEGFSRILSEDYGAKLDEEARRFIEHVLHNAQIMGSLIEDLLSFHRLGEKPVQKTNVDMTQLTRDILTALPKKENVQVKLPELPPAQGDLAQLHLAWEHLISNALKFSKRQEQPVIEFGAKQKDHRQIYWVRDNGVGFDMQYSDKLFQIFQKLQKDADFDGNGIGLALVKRVAERHEGRAWAEASPNAGATFYLELPA
jgi:light-regulated signal transduction histidine kinase (bacteriophytochrome)